MGKPLGDEKAQPKLPPGAYINGIDGLSTQQSCVPHTPGGKHAAWVDRHPPLSHRRTSGTHFRVARAILSGVPQDMRFATPNTLLEYHLVINSRGGGRPGKNGPHTNYMVKCLVFEISNRTNQTNMVEFSLFDTPEKSF